jgi:hypothetical protein
MKSRAIFRSPGPESSSFSAALPGVVADSMKPSLKFPPGASFTVRFAGALNWAAPLADKLR